jgi:hypothetical protein
MHARSTSTKESMELKITIRARDEEVSILKAQLDVNTLNIGREQDTFGQFARCLRYKKGSGDGNCREEARERDYFGA